MSINGIAALTCLGTVLLGMAATHPEELRGHRWLKIGLSLPLVVLIASIFYDLAAVRGYFAMLSFGLLAFIWRSPLAHAGSLAVSRLLYGDWNRPTGIQANFSGAKALHKHGDLEDAIRHTRAELEKDTLSYEGLLLLSELYEQTQQSQKAVSAVTRLLENKRLTPEQRHLISVRKEKLQEHILVAQLNAR